MIPKVIHYCWFGRGEKPEIVKICMESWKKNCPDFKIIEWNEDNFKVDSCKYAAEAYANKKWAFVSDYARIKILEEHGGIYIDTDVEIIKPLNSLLDYKGFAGFEKELDGSFGVNTGSMMGAEKHNEFLRQQLKKYEEYCFVENDRLNLTTCVEYTTKLLLDYGLKLNNETQEVLNLTILPSDYFSSRNMKTGLVEETNNTVSIHRYAGSWADPVEQYGYTLKWKMIKKYGIKVGRVVYLLKYTKYIVQKRGIRGLTIKIKGKLQ